MKKTVIKCDLCGAAIKIPSFNTYSTGAGPAALKSHQGRCSIETSEARTHYLEHGNWPDLPRRKKPTRNPKHETRVRDNAEVRAIKDARLAAYEERLQRLPR